MVSNVQRLRSAPGDAAPAGISRAALRGFFALADYWGLTRDQAMRLLGIDSTSTYSLWKREGTRKLPADTLERISYLLGIHKALRIIFSRHEDSVREWIKKPNEDPFFGGRSALDYMLAGRVVDLYQVRRYLDAHRGGW